MSHKLNVACLVSVGRHPASGRDRRSQVDACAVQMGLALAGKELDMGHVGDAANPALRSYLGMGLASMTVIEQAATADVLPSLVDYLQKENADIILMGMRTEQGEASGMLPYALAAQLGVPLVSGIVAVEEAAQGGYLVTQALARGQRRQLHVAGRFIASVDVAAPAGCQSAFGAAKRGQIETAAGNAANDEETSAWEVREAAKRMKRIGKAKAKGKSAAERFKAATAAAPSKGGQVMVNESITEKAEAVYRLLKEEKVVR